MPGSTMQPYITADDLEDALTPTTFLACFDNDNTNNSTTVKASSPVAKVIRRAHSRVVARLGNLYKNITNVDPTTEHIPDLLYDAEVGYAVALSLLLHPEYVRTFGESKKVKDAFDQAEATMKLLQEAVLRIVDLPPAAAPLNVGGVVIDGGQRVFLDSPDGSNNSGDF